MAEEKKSEEKKEEKPTPKDNLVVTKHTMKIGGKDKGERYRRPHGIWLRLYLGLGCHSVVTAGA